MLLQRRRRHLTSFVSISHQSEERKRKKGGVKDQAIPSLFFWLWQKEVNSRTCEKGAQKADHFVDDTRKIYFCSSRLSGKLRIVDSRHSFC